MKSKIVLFTLVFSLIFVNAFANCGDNFQAALANAEDSHNACLYNAELVSNFTNIELGNNEWSDHIAANQYDNMASDCDSGYNTAGCDAQNALDVCLDNCPPGSNCLTPENRVTQ